MKITKYMPWLFNPPNTITSQGPKEFLECVSHIRLLSWLLLGAVNHTMLVGSKEGSPCQPIPLEASCHIADHIEVILAGFAEQSKTSVVHMCSLFHAFILSQLWTVYLEHVQPSGNTKEEQLLAPSILLDFWVKVTPGILQLVSHSKVMEQLNRITNSVCICSGFSRNGQSPLPEPDGGPPGVQVHHPGQADAPLVPRPACI